MALEEIRLPEVGGGEPVMVTEIYVKEGDVVELDSPLLGVESEKAVVDVPSPQAGTIKEIKISKSTEINDGDLLFIIDSQSAETADAKPAEAEKAPAPTPPPVQVTSTEKKRETPAAPVASVSGAKPHGSPSVRAFARRLGINLSEVPATGKKSRILHVDVEKHVKERMTTGGGGGGIPPLPVVDFASFGEIESRPLNKIKRLTAQRLSAGWLNSPLVTQFEKSDITEMENFRQDLNKRRRTDADPKFSPLVFIIKATVTVLKRFDTFNSSLSQDKSELIIRKYYNIGVAVETPNGLVVPVIKDADTLSLTEIALELGRLSKSAREGKLKPSEMTGGTFTISSLGGIGGVGFTPLPNPPEVAILGLSRSAMEPLWNGSEFRPRLMLPFSLTYDHRVIDGAEGARFAVAIKETLEDLRRVIV